MQKVTSVLLALLVSPAFAVLLRGREDPATPEEIKEKWSKMDEFIEVMFTMACKWKNGKDVFNEAKEMLRDGKVEGADGYQDAVKELQAGNVKGLQRSCGLIIAESKKECREGCAKRWNQAAVKRDGCDQKCEKLYANFDRSCGEKAQGLVSVYKQKAQKNAAQRQCYEGFCKEFPMVWMKDSEDKMKTEVTDQCKERCKDDNVKAGCQRSWALNVDMITAEVASECAEKSSVSDCFKDKQTAASADYDSCKSDTKTKCDTAFDECKTKGKTDKTFKDAKAFCTDRKKMCQKQADEKCLAENKKALNKGETECKASASEEVDTCQEDTLKSKEEEHEKKCIAETGPKCKGKCEKKCQVTKMQECLATTKNKDDPGKMFCKDFYDMLHTSSEVDPVTGDPDPKL